jgi:hypothetical protein
VKIRQKKIIRHTGEGRCPACLKYWIPAFAGMTIIRGAQNFGGNMSKPLWIIGNKNYSSWSLRTPFSMLLLAVMLVTACSSTQIKSIWKDAAYQSRPARIMVIGVAKDPLERRLFEDEFVVQLKARGTEAFASYTVLPDKQQDDQAVIAAKVKELGADTVLITRLVSRKTVRTYVPGTIYYPPPYYGTWPDYYGYGYRYIYSPGYIAEDEYAVMETNLYETAQDKLIWAASSETMMTHSDHKQIKSYVGIMVEAMAGYGLLGR